jgi:uncharacterized membrane protein YvbJ
MYCAKCGTQNPDDGKFCSKCGNNLNSDNSTLSVSSNEKKGVKEQLHIISEEIEKLGTFYKIGFYLQGLALWVVFLIYTLFIGPIIVYFSGNRGWPKNSLVKAVLYYQAYVLVIISIIAVFVIIAAVIAAFVFGMGR